jgi:hypothetical protein
VLVRVVADGQHPFVVGADPGMADVLAAVPNETAVPMIELGHSVEPELAEPANWFY